MNRNLLLLLLLAILLLPIRLAAQSSTASLKGFIADEASGILLGHANIMLMLDGKPVAARFAAADGTFIIDALPAGRYELQVNYIGYESRRIKNIVIDPPNNTFLRIKLDTRFKKRPALLCSAGNMNANATA